MIINMENALKNKLEGFENQRKVSKLFIICSISKDHSREQVEREKWLRMEKSEPITDDSPVPTITGRLLLEISWKSTPYRVRFFIEEGDLEKVLNQNLHAIEDSHQRGSRATSN
ncbi:hypothetical protein M9H77_12767 [Catharanthus roseus]|uniref:Uncharacterized protein n=1 Tax=Catharanthus roseus TaxID=4058 RepID=A0ACC0BIH2_CATRO|nr:hypothetical protein M9H77_12767 [Catharanthus roseus]